MGGVGVALCVLAWELMIQVKHPLPSVLPRPSTVFGELVTLLSSSAFYHDIELSLFRVFAGYLLGVASGLAVGIGIARVRLVRDLLTPSLQALRFIIPFAWIPIAAVIFGLSEAGKVFITWYAAFFVIAFNTEAALDSMETTVVNAARTLGARRARLTFSVIIPNAFPGIITGLRLGLGLSWISLLAAELVNASAGLGFFILQQSALLETPSVIAGMIVIGVIGYLMNGAFRLVESYVGKRSLSGELS